MLQTVCHNTSNLVYFPLEIMHLDINQRNVKFSVFLTMGQMADTKQYSIKMVCHQPYIDPT
jgi:hypothetical protein